jgi:hypothetical protein
VYLADVLVSCVTVMHGAYTTMVLVQITTFAHSLVQTSVYLVLLGSKWAIADVTARVLTDHGLVMHHLLAKLWVLLQLNHGVHAGVM